jgi:hypothetical protein
VERTSGISKPELSTIAGRSTRDNGIRDNHCQPSPATSSQPPLVKRGTVSGRWTSPAAAQRNRILEHLAANLMHQTAPRTVELDNKRAQVPTWADTSSANGGHLSVRRDS